MADDHGQDENEAFASIGQMLRVGLTMASQLAQARAMREQRRSAETERQERAAQADLDRYERDLKTAKTEHDKAVQNVVRIKEKALRDRDTRIKDAERAAAQIKRDQAYQERDRLREQQTAERRSHDTRRRIAEHHLNRADRDPEFLRTATATELAARYRQAKEWENESGIAQTVAEKIEGHAKAHGIDLDDYGPETPEALRVAMKPADAPAPDGTTKREGDVVTAAALADIVRNPELLGDLSAEELADRHAMAKLPTPEGDETSLSQTAAEKIEEYSREHGIDLDAAAERREMAEALVADADSEDREVTAALAQEQAQSSGGEVDPQALSPIATAAREEIRSILAGAAEARARIRGGADAPAPQAREEVSPATAEPGWPGAVAQAKARADATVDSSPKYDSAERRAETAEYLAVNTDASEEAIGARMQADVTLAHPPQAAVGGRPKTATVGVKASTQIRDLNQKTTDRQRQEPGR